MSAGPGMSTGRVLVVDDEPQIRRMLRVTLTGAGYEVDDCKTGEQALDKLRSYRPALVLLDLNIPGMGGMEACRALRASDADVAILMLTVRNGERDKVQALDAGADDFITKPYSTPELLARIRAALRRHPDSSRDQDARWQAGDLLVDFGKRTVERKNGATHRLTPKELELLRYLMRHANQAVTHRQILQAVWGPDYGDQVDYLRAFIKTLRRKIEADSENPRLIVTEPWIGYRFTSDVVSS